MTSNHHAPYVLGYTRNTMVVNKEKQYREVEQNFKNDLSSDCRLKLACTKLELLVIVDQHATVNTFPGVRLIIVRSVVRAHSGPPQNFHKMGV